VSPSRRLTAEQRREQIVQVAGATFAELGVAGASTRLIAERAGITEAYLFRRFASKFDLYQAAVARPLRQLIEDLAREAGRLAEVEEVDHGAALLRTHELILTAMAGLAPLVAGSVSSDGFAGGSFYRDELLPELRQAIGAVVPGITGYDLSAGDVDLFVEATLGIHLTIALEHHRSGKELSVESVARQVTEMFAPGVSDGVS
jgi:TetR/AcrR family transcriptional regulator